jgi:hypothetical protein
MAIIYRLVKGAPLTHAELDNNFTELIELVDGRLDTNAGVVPEADNLNTYLSAGRWQLDTDDVTGKNYPNASGGWIGWIDIIGIDSWDVRTQVIYDSVNNKSYFRGIHGTPTLIYEPWKEIGDNANKADKDLTIFTYTASHTLVLANRAGLIRMNVASANTLTVPPNSSVAFPVGTQIIVSQAGAGQTTVVAGSGVTINSSAGKLKFYGQYSGVTLAKTATDTWLLMGDIVA